MIGFWIVNLLIPNDPDKLILRTLTGEWELHKFQKYAESKSAIAKGQCALTYSIENLVSMENGAALCDASLEEMTPILLGASYLSGLSVTANRSLPFSEAQIFQPSDYWPRERAIGEGNPCVKTQ